MGVQKSSSVMSVVAVVLIWSTTYAQPNIETASNIVGEIFVDNLSTYWGVSHMEPDQRIEGNMLITDGQSIITSNGVNTDVVAGQTNNSELFPYREGVGSEALFGEISGFVQVNSTTIIVSDGFYRCLRSIDRTTNRTSHFAGVCTRTIGGPFQYPTSIISDAKSPDHLLLTDSERNAIYQIHLTTRNITTLNTLRSRKNSVRGMVQDPNTGDLYLSMKRRDEDKWTDKVLRLDFHSNYTTKINIALFNRTTTYQDFFMINSLTLIDNATKLVYLDGEDNDLTIHVSSNLYAADKAHCSFKIKNVTNLQSHFTRKIGPIIQIARDTMYYAFQVSEHEVDKGHFIIEKSPWSNCPGNSALDGSVV